MAHARQDLRAARNQQEQALRYTLLQYEIENEVRDLE